jgi:hypothetical protein
MDNAETITMKTLDGSQTMTIVRTPTVAIITQSWMHKHWTSTSMETVVKTDRNCVHWSFGTISYIKHSNPEFILTSSLNIKTESHG